LAKYLSAAITAWRLAWKSPQHQPCLFDPMAVACIVKPDLFEWKTGKVKVELAGESTYGYTTFTAGEGGPHKVAWTCNRERCINWYLGKILGE
jgi:inosine-uridine nucleoside N-ribohydrolase